MRRRTLLAVAAALTLTGSAPAPAGAQVAWAPCTDGGFQAFECARYGVPLDRSGAVPGTIDLFARRLVAANNPSRTAVVVLSGGPGQAATPGAGRSAVVLASALGERDLLVFDQRGTGSSGALGCPSLRTARTNRAAAEGCANDIGAPRAFFRTPESVADIEDLRAAAGYERLVLFGVSYGTKVALAYAARHPDRVERLVLDSTVTPEGPDPLARSSFAATNRILTHVCAEGRCRGITPNPVADVRRLVARRTIRGRYVTPRGRLRRASLDRTRLFDMLVAADLNPAWRSLLPAAFRAAALGDESPLLRLASTMADAGKLQTTSTAVNEALYLATVCEEVAFPWDRTGSVERRVEQGTAAVNALPLGAVLPFDRATVARSSLLPICLGWPTASPPPENPPELPRVPTLLLAGEADFRTPLEDANAVAARLGATPVVVPHTGHSVLGNDFSECARSAVATFFRDGTTPPCPPGSRPVASPGVRPPLSLARVPQARRYRGRVGRTLNAFSATLSDALVVTLGAELDGLSRVAGVRGGTVTLSGRGIRLNGFEFVPGVRLSGLLPPSAATAKLRITGRAAARGSLTITRTTGAVRGRLGGRRISARPRAASAAPARGDWGGPPSAREVVPFPALVG